MRPVLGAPWAPSVLEAAPALRRTCPLQEPLWPPSPAQAASRQSLVGPPAPLQLHFLEFDQSRPRPQRRPRQRGGGLPGLSAVLGASR